MSAEARPVAVDHSFLAGGGITGALVRSIDWSETALGPIATWPDSLKSTLGLILHARHPMFLWWGPDLIQFYNDAYLPSFGVGKHPTAMGQRGRDCWGEIWDIIWPQIDDVMARGRASWNEDALVPIFRNGKLEDVYWTYGYSPVFDADGKIRGTLVVCTETTARVMAEQALQRSEARFRAIIETSSDAISLSDADGRVFYRSPSIARILGWSAEELSERTWGDNIHPDDRLRFGAEIARVVAGRYWDAAQEFRFLHRDGSIRWLEGTCTNLVHDPDVGAIVGNFHDITSRKQAQGALEASELRYRRLIEELPEPVMVHVDGRIAYANAASAHGLGFGSASEIVGHSILEYASADTRPKIEARMRLASEGSAHLLDVVEQTFVRPSDGSELHAEVRSTPIVYDGRPAILSIARDLTARVEATRERERLVLSLDFERRRLGMLLQHAPAFIAVLRGQDHILELVNDSYELLIGRSDVVGRSLLEVMPELRGQRVIELLDRVVATGEPIVVEGMPVTLARRAGAPPEQRYVDFVYQPLVEADGTRSGVFVHGFDVTLATLARQRVRAQFEGIPAPTYIWQRVEREGRRAFALADFNQAAIAASNGDIARHLGELADLYFADTPGVVEEIERCLELGVTTQRELDGKRDSTGKTRRLFVTYAPAPPDLVIVHTEDVTERMELEQQLRQAQKMDAIGRLAGGVAHDFNNLLSVILGFADLSLAELRAPDPLRAPLQQIKTAAQRATALTRQLLAFSRQQVLQPQVLDLTQVVTGMSSMLARLLGEDVELVVLPSEGIGRVLADPGQIEQVVMNLAVNARDAMPQGGKLTFEIENVVFDEGAIGPGRPVPAGSYTMLAVSDTGVGMDATTRARVFEPFFTTKEVGKGTGLGLATVFGIVKQSGGHVAVYSELGVGTTFKVYLPRTDRADEAAPAARIPASARGSETILLAEDEEQVRLVACTVLQRNGYQVLAAPGGAEALLLSARHQGQIHLLLTDVVMPRMSGPKLAEQLVAQRPDIKVLFASGYTDDAIVHHGVLDGGTAFLQKPFTPQSLLHKVREVLDMPSGATAKSP